MDDFETHPVGTAARIAELEAALTRANAATAAAYDAADKIVCERHRIHMTAKGRNPDDYVSDWSFTADAIRALATPDQTAALDKMIAEAVKPYVEALRVLISHTHECERELTEALYHADFCGESRPLTDARAILAASKKGGV